MRLAALSSLFLLAVAACGGSSTPEPEETNAFIRVPAQGAMMSAAYFTVTRETDDELIAASIEGIGRVELHTVTDDDGVKRMRMGEGYAVKAGKPLVLKPGGNHLMLFEIEKPLQAGESREATLTFASGATELISLPVGQQ